MNKLVHIALFVLLSICSKVNGQTYTPNSNNTYTTCSGTFYDSGGANNNYGNNQNYTVTFCSGNGQPIYLNFTAFNLQNGSDFLLIFAGNSTAATQIGTYSANSPGTVVSANGCITFQFVSNNTNSDPGWALYRKFCLHTELVHTEQRRHKRSVVSRVHECAGSSNDNCESLGRSGFRV